MLIELRSREIISLNLISEKILFRLCLVVLLKTLDSTPTLKRYRGNLYIISFSRGVIKLTKISLITILRILKAGRLVSLQTEHSAMVKNSDLCRRQIQITFFDKLKTF